jgi:hypothetical protein
MPGPAGLKPCLDPASSFGRAAERETPRDADR